jgi:hypothetical protein
VRIGGKGGVDLLGASLRARSAALYNGSNGASSSSAPAAAASRDRQPSYLPLPPLLPNPADEAMLGADAGSETPSKLLPRGLSPATAVAATAALLGGAALLLFAPRPTAGTAGRFGDAVSSAAPATAMTVGGKQRRPLLDGAGTLSQRSAEALIRLWQVCCAVLCCAVLCCAVLCCAVLCCAVRSCGWKQIQ